jgi:HAD superfamily hydrolase (TIGR01509 family)
MDRMADNRQIDWVILDAMGVIYRNGDDVTDLMIPYLRERGCELPDDAIYYQFARCSEGYISSDAMWAGCGLEVIDGTDLEFTFRYALNPGVRETLEALREKGIRVACLSNGPGEWSKLLRRRFGLEKWIEKWVISGDVRCEKPSAEIYNILLKTCGTTPEKCLFADDNPRNIAAADKLGFKTFQFTSRDPAAQFARILEQAK